MSTLSSQSTDLPPEQQSVRAKSFHPTGTFIRFQKHEIEQSIPDRFEAQVLRYPDRLAVKTRSQQLTYQDLNQAANRIAHAILTRLGDKEEPVAILIEQSESQIAAILGVL